MLSATTTTNRKQTTTPIYLPNQKCIEEIRSNTSKTRSNENLAELAAFDPSHMSSSPPGGSFLHNLRQRIEKA